MKTEICMINLQKSYVGKLAFKHAADCPMEPGPQFSLKSVVRSAFSTR